LKCRDRYDQMNEIYVNVQHELAVIQREFSEVQWTCEENEALESEILQQEQLELEEKRLIAEYRKEQGMQKVLELERKQREMERSLEGAHNTHMERLQNAIEHAKHGRRNAVQRLKETKQFQIVMQQQEIANQLETQRKQRALVELGKNTEQVKDKIKARNERRAKKSSQREIDEHEELSRILNQGGNPERVIRERKAREKLEKLQKTFRQDQEKKIEDIVTKLQAEREFEQREKQKVQAHKQSLKDFNKTTSQAAREQERSSYIMGKTLNGVEMIDPLGKQGKIHPSKVMLPHRDWKFGLGATHERNPKFLNKVKSKYPDQTYYHESVPGGAPKTRPATATESTGRDDDQESDEELAEPEIAGLWTARTRASSANASTKQQRIQVRELSVLEKKHLQDAKERAKQNMVQKQVVWGKEFQGQAFIPEPKTILFKDFELGQTYERKITLTNASYTFNTFKVLELKPEIKDLFEIQYTLPGKMSAGTTCDLIIRFTPRTLQDIHDELPLLAQTGHFSIPLECLTKKVAISVDPDRTVQLGSVMLAESNTATIKITNAGALDTSFRLTGDAIQLHSVLRGRSSADQPDRVLTLSCTSGYVEKFSSTSIQVTFSPKTTGSFKSTLAIIFEHQEDEVEIELIGEGRNVSIYLDNTVLDFQTCYVDTLYRDVLTVYNRGSISMKCEFKPPRELAKHMEFVPKMGFVQTDKPFAVQIKFRPTSEILQDCADFITNLDQGQIVIPITVVVPEQVMPVVFDFIARISVSQISILPDVLHFGKCSVEESVKMPIRLTNKSLLSQNIGFVNLPSEVTIEPDDGFGVILARESLSYDVIFSPKAAIDYHFKLVLKTERNETFTIPCIAVGIQPPLKFSISKIKLASVAMGDYHEQQVVLTNNSKKERSFTLVPPANSGITFTPTMGAIAAKSNITIIVRFSAPRPIVEKPPPPPSSVVEKTPEPVNTEKVKTPRSTQKKPTSKKKEETVVIVAPPIEEPPPVIEEKKTVDDMFNDWESSGENEPWSKHKTFVVPCLIKDYELASIYLQVQVTLVLASLVLTDDDDQVIDEIDFGSVPLYHRSDRVISVCNRSGNQTKIVLSDRNMTNSSFSIVEPSTNKTIVLNNGQTLPVTVRFHPDTADTSILTSLQILSTSTNNAQLMLRGSGQSPQMSLEFSSFGNNNSIVDMGDVAANQAQEEIMTLTNHGSLTIPFKIEFPRERLHPFNHNGTSPFVASPCNGNIGHNERVQVKLCFRPDHACEQYRSLMMLQFGGSIHKRNIPIRGRAWNVGVFMILDKSRAAIQSSSNSARKNSVQVTKTTEKAPKRTIATPKKGAKEETKEDVVEEQVQGSKQLVPPPPLHEDDEAFLSEDPFSSISVEKKKKLNFTFENVKVGQVRMVPIDIGLTKPKQPSTTVAKTEYAFENLTEQDTLNGFSLDAPKGTIDAGTKKSVMLCFAPTQQTISQVPIDGVDIWVESTLRCTLKDPHNNNNVSEYVIDVRGQVITR
jgi:hypothetical protein